MTVIAVDGGGSRLRIARVDEPTDPFDGVAVDTPVTTDLLVEALISAVGDADGVEGIGIGLAGLVDHDTGWLRWSPHVSGDPVDIRGHVTEAKGVVTVVDNDANMAALAEALHGAGRGHRMVLGVSIGTGIGGGLVVDGRLERGRGFLGEIGHMARGGEVGCRCGRIGCWETTASGLALDRAARRIVQSDPRGSLAFRVGEAEPTGVDLVASMEAGDRAAADAFAAVAREIGRGLADLVAVLDPDVIVLGGGVGALGDPLLDAVRPAMMEATVGMERRRSTPVVTAQFGPRAGLVGAALAAGGAG